MTIYFKKNVTSFTKYPVEVKTKMLPKLLHCAHEGLLKLCNFTLKYLTSLNSVNFYPQLRIYDSLACYGKWRYSKH